ncbi:MAG: alpha-hydroxy-acid oxidizing protein [Geminicoccaceae bacterium]|nr:alpha-hydroxy-acid oxidizing protein [Geminicoccaceae bacterium]
MKTSRIYAVHEMRRRARRRLPRMIFDFVDGGAEEERTRRSNESAFADLRLWPRPLEGTGEPDLGIELFGRRLSMPLVIGPTGLAGMLAPRAEIAAARAAAAAGIAWCMSHGSTVTIEDVARAAPGDNWFQTFVYRDRGFTRSLVERAAAAGYRALVLTIDNQALGQRERDIRNGFRIPPRPAWSNAGDLLRGLPWLARHGMRLADIRFANYDEAGFDARIVSLGARIGDMLDPAMNWDDVDELRRLWRGPLLLKGVLHPADAREAAERGVDGVIVSNHGGRQLDGAPASLHALPHVVEAAGDRLTVLHDGGIRRGADIVKAIALGARACLIGRPQLWGLAVAGEAGVARILDIYRDELVRTMVLGGWKTIADIDAGAISPGRTWPLTVT